MKKRLEEISYPKLTEDQKKEVRRWYGRELVKEEKTAQYHYAFDEYGVCQYAT
ncbi:hypothetical protein KAR91_36200 [Candidatus Pacearchaeota archaeon]|nr:hypothetical protein [Candidatus Pacearchaeota archaeon]